MFDDGRCCPGLPPEWRAAGMQAWQNWKNRETMLRLVRQRSEAAARRRLQSKARRRRRVPPERVNNDRWRHRKSRRGRNG